MRKRGSGHQNKGTEGREMGFIGLITHPKSGKTGEKDNPFLQFSGHGKPQSIPSVSPLYRMPITNTLQLSFTPLP